MNTYLIEVHHLDWDLANEDQMLHAAVTIGNDVKALAKVMLMGRYDIVAKVEVEAETQWGALEQVWSKTQHIGSDWRENDGVISISEQARSTSVGDVMVIDNTLFMVESFGISKVTF